jgi:outer membrane immunogenic protein
MKDFRAVALSLAVGAGLALAATGASADGYTRGSIKDGPYRLCGPRVGPPGVVNWTGDYFGVQGGWGLGHQDRETILHFANSYDARGGLLGAHWGYNCDLGGFVFGVQGDANRAWIKGDDAGVGGTVDETTIRWLTSANVRAGWANLLPSRQLLLYGTVGVSYANFNHNNPSGSPVNNSVSEPGWNAGLGAEWAFTSFPGLSAAFEWRRYEFEPYNLAPAGLIEFSVKPEVDTFTLRLSFHP